MTATPIPRTLHAGAVRRDGRLAARRDAAGPPGDRHARGRARPARRGRRRPRAALEGGGQAYWVCPMVRGSESETDDLAAAEARFATLKARFGGRGRAGPRPAQARAQGRRDGALRRRRSQAARRDHGDRGRRRRAERDADGDRAGRALRPRPAPPAARAGRARRGEIGLPAAARRGADRDGASASR